MEVVKEIQTELGEEYNKASYDILNKAMNEIRGLVKRLPLTEQSHQILRRIHKAREAETRL